MDRLDICIQVPRVEYEAMGQRGDENFSSEKMRAIVKRVFEIQEERYKGLDFSLNSGIPAGLIGKYCVMDSETESLMKVVYDKYNLSARAYYKILKVARTIADIEGHDRIGLEDLSEAIGYKLL